jgi:hypothetical protein
MLLKVLEKQEQAIPQLSRWKDKHSHESLEISKTQQMSK